MTPQTEAGMSSYEFRQFAKRILPRRAVDEIRSLKIKWKLARISRLPALDEKRFRLASATELGIKSGDVVFVHSSTDGLNLQFSPMVLLPILLELVGSNGTLLFPTYPKLGSYEFLMKGEVFDVRRTPSYMGLVTEAARRHRAAVRSLHPTKSVVAIGPHASEITGTHALSPYPYDRTSPYGRIRDYNAKIVGIGVSTASLSCAHCVEDELKENFPVRPYHDRLFSARCVDYDGRTRIVETYAHDMRKLKLNLPAFMKANVSEDICRDFEINGMKFFRADASRLFARMVELARERVTIYPLHLQRSTQSERKGLRGRMSP